MESEDIIKEEIDSILTDIIAVYNSSGRKVSGQFEEGLEAVYESSDTEYKGTVKGFVYLAGRGPTKKSGKSGEPSVLDRIKIWVVDKGIVSATAKKSEINSIAYAITKKIHEKGTDSSRWLKIYEEVITPERINSIINRVAELNVNKLITEINARLEILAKNV